METSDSQSETIKAVDTMDSQNDTVNVMDTLDLQNNRKKAMDTSNSRNETEMETMDCTIVHLEMKSPTTSSVTAVRTSKLHTKKQLYAMRCKLLREFRNRRKQLGDVDLPSRSRAKNNHILEKLTKNNMKFMENFDPKRSNRERRKLLRKMIAERNEQELLYGLNGVLLSSGKNVCDCMGPDCPGCHFPCPKCQSPKCGHECRVNRKWTYEEIEVDGTDIVIKQELSAGKK